MKLNYTFTLFSEPAVWRVSRPGCVKVVGWTLPSVLMRMCLVLVTAYSSSSRASEDSSRDKHCSA